MEFLENALAFSLKQKLAYFLQSLAEEFCMCAFNQITKFFAVEENSGLHERELLKYH